MKSKRTAQMTVFTGAFLLFLVQPLIARMVLPLLGGSAQVWNTCMLFFQGVLLLGYAYAHLSIQILGAKKQSVVHIILLIVACSTLPFTIPSTSVPPEDTNSVLWQLWLLTKSIGLPSLLLSATAPLVQAWFAAGHEDDKSDPYFLYAASNAGSLGALLSYPLLFEPLSTLQNQSFIWSGGYVFLIVSALYLIIWLWKQSALSSGDTKSEPIKPLHPPTMLMRGRWLLLAFVPSSMLLGVTSHMTSELPSTPVLWVLPLLLYLLSFIIAFSTQSHFLFKVLRMIQPALLCFLAALLFIPLKASGFSLHLVVLFISALILHGELAQKRPASYYLTEYYLWLAFGGVLGGLFNALLAPLLFPFVLEYPLILIVTGLLTPKKTDQKPHRFSGLMDWMAPVLLGIAAASLVTSLPRVGDIRDILSRAFILLFTGFVAHYFRKRPQRFALGLAAVLFTGFIAFRTHGTIAAARSYYGVYRIAQAPQMKRYLLFHGTTIHGAQNHAGPQPKKPISYLYPKSPAGRLFSSSPAQGKQRRFGVIGLGVGALAWYTKPGQQMRFFELDPLVYKIAQKQTFFTYLKDAKGKIDVVLGDGRLKLAKEKDSSFDLLVIDAFSSDAVPIHLLTREAIQLYLRKLRTGGLCAFHTSNRHLKINVILSAIAQEGKIAARYTVIEVVSPKDRNLGKTGMSWFIMAKTESALQKWIQNDHRWRDIASLDPAPVWTDAYASILHVIR